MFIITIVIIRICKAEVATTLVENTRLNIHINSSTVKYFTLLYEIVVRK